MRSAVDSACRFLVAMFAVTFPLEVVFLPVAGYPVSIPFLAIALLFPILLWRAISQRSIDWRIAATTLLFASWALASGIYHGKVASITSLLVFVFLFGLFAFRLEDLKLESTAFRWIIRGAVLAVAIAGYTVAASIGLLPPLHQIVPGIAEQSTYAIAGFERVPGPFTEPSHFARYLVFVLIFLDFGRSRGYVVGRERALRVILILLLVSTVSIAGWLLYAAYLSISWMGRLMRRYGSFSEVPKRKRVAPILLAGALAFVAMMPETTRNTIFDYGVVRAQNVVAALVLNELNTSEGSRLNAFGASIDYALSGRPEDFLVGEGFNEYESLLRFLYAQSNSALERGTVQNVFAAVTFGTGFVGLVLYVLLLASIYWARVRPSAAGIDKQYFVMWVVSHMATGQLIVYTFPGYLYWYLLFSHPERVNDE